MPANRQGSSQTVHRYGVGCSSREGDDAGTGCIGEISDSARHTGQRLEISKCVAKQPMCPEWAQENGRHESVASKVSKQMGHLSLTGSISVVLADSTGKDAYCNK